MELSRKERICAITSILTQNAGKLFSLSYFCEMFGAAKSSISEDIATIKETFSKCRIAKIEVALGAGGGVKLVPTLTDEQRVEYKSMLAEALRDEKRILPGGFIYTADLFLNHEYVHEYSNILLQRLVKHNV